MRRSHVFGGIAAAILVLAAGCGKKEEPAAPTAAKPASAPAPAAASGGGDVIKIGHVSPLSGGQAAMGKDNENGARMAIEELKKTPGGSRS